VTLRGNRFHDYYGCDSIHGRAGRNLVIERNRFGRVPRCDGPPMKCNHQDAIELFLGNGVVIRRNVFRESGYGRGQIFLSQSTHRVQIVNNVFLGGNLRVPGVTPPRGIVVGSMVSRDLPQYVRIANNTILTGGRDDDEFPSVVISGFYLDAAPRIRPVLANNVIAGFGTRWSARGCCVR
jgi:Right handed beta helix region